MRAVVKTLLAIVGIVAVCVTLIVLMIGWHDLKVKEKVRTTEVVIEPGGSWLMFRGGQGNRVFA